MEGSAIQSPFLMIGAAVGRDEGQLQLVWKARMIKSANSVRWSHSGSENRHELASKLWRAAGSPRLPPLDSLPSAEISENLWQEY